MHKSIEILNVATCRDLTVLETVKAELGIPDVDTSKDDRLGVLIKQASGIIAAYCDQVFAQETVIETFWSDWPSEWTSSFLLSREPVSDIVSVVVDDLVLDSDQYRLAADGHIHRVDPLVNGFGRWFWSTSAVITYTAGYPLLDGLPYGIEKAALMLIKDYYYSSSRDPRVRSENIPGVRDVSYWIGGNTGGNTATLPPDVIALLAPYRRLVFA
jgi:hypothetical protein